VICGRNIWKNERSASGRSWQARRIGARADAVEHERLALGRLRQGIAVADHADAAGRAAGAAAAHAGMRHIVAQARLEHAEAFRHAHRPAVAIRQDNHAMTALVQRAHAAPDQGQSDQAEIADQEIIGDAVKYTLLGWRADVLPGEIFGFPLRIAAFLNHHPPALIEAEHRQRRDQHRCGQQVRRGVFEERLHPQPEIQSDAAVNPGDDQDDEHQPHLVGPHDPIGVEHLRIELFVSEQRLSEPHAGQMGDDQCRNA
jgi:hypothetical protein